MKTELTVEQIVAIRELLGRATLAGREAQAFMALVATLAEMQHERELARANEQLNTSASS